MICRFCKLSLGSAFSSAELFGKKVFYFDCNNCGYVQTEEPTWLDKAYSSPINIYDTGIIARNLGNVSIVLATLILLNVKHGIVIDFAGGYGLLVRMLRDKGINAYWTDPYCQNLFAKGFEYKSGEANLVIAFEAFEHFVYPSQEIDKMFSISPNILLSTNIIPNPIPKPNDWWYYGLEHGQHIGFFGCKTLEYISKKYNKHFISDGKSYHLFSEKKLSLWKWILLRKISNNLQILMTYGLKFKTWDDHQELKNKLI